MTTSTCTDAFYVNDLDSKQLSAGACPVKGCMSDVKAQLVVYNKKHNLPFCPVHGLRIHEKTFVYYNGGSKEQKELAFKRNIAFNWNFFRAHFLQNTKKVGGHRLSWENSEDAVTYNVFTELARTQNALRQLLKDVTGTAPNNPVELYLWGYRIDLASNTAPYYPYLNQLINELEPGISIATEPDIILRVPGDMLVFIEAKFTSENSLSKDRPAKEGENPHSAREMVQRYVEQNPFLAEANPFAPDRFPAVIYGQLFRNLVFCASAAKLEGIEKWAVVNLRAQKFMEIRAEEVESEVKELLLPAHQGRFKHYTWERLHEHIKNEADLKNVVSYLEAKSAFCEPAFVVG